MLISNRWFQIWSDSWGMDCNQTHRNEVHQICNRQANWQQESMVVSSLVPRKGLKKGSCSFGQNLQGNDGNWLVFNCVNEIKSGMNFPTGEIPGFTKFATFSGGFHVCNFPSDTSRVECPQRWKPTLVLHNEQCAAMELK